MILCLSASLAINLETDVKASPPPHRTTSFPLKIWPISFVTPSDMNVSIINGFQNSLLVYMMQNWMISGCTSSVGLEQSRDCLPSWKKILFFIHSSFFWGNIKSIRWLANLTSNYASDPLMHLASVIQFPLLYTECYCLRYFSCLQIYDLYS